MFALYHRDVHDGAGQVVDVSLFESLFSLLGPLPAEYAALGRLRERNGSRSKNAGPRGCYRTSDGRWIAVSGSTPKMAERFLQSLRARRICCTIRVSPPTKRASSMRGELDRADRRRHRQSRTLEENLRIIDDNALTAVAVQTVADIERDPHWRARQLLLDVPNGQGTVRMHNVVPRLSETPGEIREAGGALGQDNDAVYGASSA